MLMLFVYSINTTAQEKEEIVPLSLDGENWIIHRKTNSLPGLTEGMDLGLAARALDKKQYTVNFTDWDYRVGCY